MLAILFAFIITFYITRYIYFNSGWEWYSVAIFAVTCFAILSALFSRIAKLLPKGWDALLSPKGALVLAGLGLFASAYIFLADYWLAFVIGGVVLSIFGWLLPMKKHPQIPTPASWDEAAIEKVAASFSTNTDALAQYLDTLTTTFVIGQQQKIVEERTAFLQKLNEMYKAGQEAYGHERAMSGGRIKTEEDTKDIEAQSANEIAQLRGALEAAKLKQQLRDIENPPQPPAAKPEETIKQKRERLKSELAELRQLKLEARQIQDVHEQVRMVNLVDDKIRRKEDELRKVL